jgi:DNA-binding transcriptional ArsR family regulator
VSELPEHFAALADPTRFSVVELLKVRPYRAGELAEALAMTPPALSRHLRVLRKSGLIVDDGDDNDARVKCYRIDATRFATMREWLAEVEAFWNDQLGSFKDYAESKSVATRGAIAKATLRKTSNARARRR